MKSLGAVLGFNLALLLIVEGFFRFVPMGPAKTFFIPGKEPGTVISNRQEFDPHHANSINDVTMQVKKVPGVFRIFFVGDSTAAGLHYNPHASIARWLELGLRDVLPDQKIEVVNAGAGSKSSDTVLRVLDEMLGYEPDLVVVYSGQNEYLEPRVLEFRQARLHPHLVRLKAALRRSAFYAFLQDYIESVRRKRAPKPQIETAMFGPSFAGADLTPIALAYESNLREMARLSKAHGVPILFLTLVSNLRDWEPNVSYFSKPVTASQRDTFVAAIHAASEALAAGRWEEAKNSLRQAESIDFHVAELQWQRAKLLEKEERWDEAYLAYNLASALDGKPWRNLPQFIETVRRVADSEGALLYDAQDRFRHESPHGLIGDNLIIDNCHPSLHGQFILARGILAMLANKGLIAPQESWQIDKLKAEEEYQAQLFSDPKWLADSYFRTGSYNLGWVLLRYDGTPRLLRAARNFEQALTLWPDDPQALFGLAQVERVQGKDAAANEHLAKAKTALPTIERDLHYLAQLVEPLLAKNRR